MRRARSSRGNSAQEIMYPETPAGGRSGPQVECGERWEKKATQRPLRERLPNMRSASIIYNMHARGCYFCCEWPYPSLSHAMQCYNNTPHWLRAADFFHTRERRGSSDGGARTLSQQKTQQRADWEETLRLKGGGKEKRAPSRSVSVGLRSPRVLQPILWRALPPTNN